MKNKYGFEIGKMEMDYENPYMKVLKTTVVGPDDRNYNYWILDKNDFSVVIPLFEDGTTLLVGQYRVHVDYYSWEFAMGSIHEDPLSGAKRELKEETGLEAQEWEEIGKIYWGPGVSKNKMFVFVAKNITEGFSEQEDSEFITSKKVQVSEVGEMIVRGEILDGPTINAYHFLENYLEK